MVNLSNPDSAAARAYLTSESDLRYGVVSPDGTLAAYASNESGQYEIYIRSFPEPPHLEEGIRILTPQVWIVRSCVYPFPQFGEPIRCTAGRNVLRGCLVLCVRRNRCSDEEPESESTDRRYVQGVSQFRFLLLLF